KLALNKPRFDQDAVDRIRQQLLAALAYATRGPDKVAPNEWNAAAFKAHPYTRPANGTENTVPSITSADLEGHRHRIFATHALATLCQHYPEGRRRRRTRRSPHREAFGRGVRPPAREARARRRLQDSARYRRRAGSQRHESPAVGGGVRARSHAAQGSRLPPRR